MAKDFYETSNNSVSLFVVSADSSITGTIESKKDIRIDGSVDGKIICSGKIVIGENAVVNGEVQANDIDLYGKLTGKVNVANNFVLKSTSSYSGEAHMKNLISEMGAQINLTADTRTDSFEEVAKAASTSGNDDENLY